MDSRGALEATAATKLAKICGLFSSNHDGERAAAAWQADRIVRAAGLTWLELLVNDQHAQPQTYHTSPRDILTRYSADLTVWERTFLDGIARRPGTLSARQMQIFLEIRRRVTGGAA